MVTDKVTSVWRELSCTFTMALSVISVPGLGYGIPALVKDVSLHFSSG